jgi:hypothetical protein
MNIENIYSLGFGNTNSAQYHKDGLDIYENIFI